MALYQDMVLYQEMVLYHDMEVGTYHETGYLILDFGFSFTGAKVSRIYVGFLCYKPMSEYYLQLLWCNSYQNVVKINIVNAFLGDTLVYF